jgi:hypothetical protein
LIKNVFHAMLITTRERFRLIVHPAMILKFSDLLQNLIIRKPGSDCAENMLMLNA